MSERTQADVLFRRFAGEVVALLPGFAGSPTLFECACYAHMGQHGSAHLGHVMRMSRPATPDEYASLMQEMTALGYDLTVVPEPTSEHTAMRIAQIRGANGTT